MNSMDIDKKFSWIQKNYQTFFYLIAPLVAFCCFINTVGQGFVYDDIYHVVRVESVMQDWSFDNLKLLLTSDYWYFITHDFGQDEQRKSVYYRPLVSLFFMITHTCVGTSAWKWHLIGVFLQAIASVLAYQLLLTTFLRSGLTLDKSKLCYFALIGSVVFAAHPLQSECVAWVSAHGNILSAILAFSTILAYLRAKTEVGRASIFWLTLSILFYSLGLLAKESGVVVALLLLFYELFLLKNSTSWYIYLRRATLSGIGFFLATIIYFYFRIKIIGSLNPEVFSLDFTELTNIPTQAQIFTLPIIFLLYIKNIALPISLAPFYPVRHIFEPSLENFYLPLLLVITIVALVLITSRDNVRARVGFIWLFIPLIPVLNIKVFIPEDLIHDRYVYFSVLGAGVLLAESFYLLNNFFIPKEVSKEIPKEAQREYSSIWPLKASLTIVLAVVIVLMGLLTIKQNQIWENEWSFWLSAKETFPDSCSVNKELARLSLAEGLQNQAISYYEEAKKTCPYSVSVLQKLGVLYLNIGNYNLAEKEFQKLIEISPHPSISAEAYYALGLTYQKKKENEKALDSYKKALELDPTGAKAKNSQTNIEKLVK